ncbi:hypothetical protein [Microbacterium sp. ZW T5_56]|uniref:hypothetical protein n=1 Tax=Microbacterium sp. ZW T5_56 TaxID=3378081 RepID=UPI003853ADC0
MSRRPATAALLARTAVTAPVMSAFVVLVVAVLSVIGAAAPAFLESARTDTVRVALAQLPPSSRDLSGSGAGLPRLSADDRATWTGPTADLREQVAQRMPETADVLGEARMIVQVTSGWSTPVGDPPEHQVANDVMLTLDPRWAARVDIVEGTAPGVPVAGGDIPVAISVDASAKLEWPIGQRRDFAGRVLVLTGTYEVQEPDDPDWTYSPSSVISGRAPTSEGGIVVVAAAYAAPESMDQFVTDFEETATTVSWIPVQGERITADSADDVAAGLRGASTSRFRVAMTFSDLTDRGYVLTSAAPPVLTAAVGRGGALLAVFAVIAVGPLAVALVALALAGRMLAQRRAGIVRLVSARGASATGVSLVLGVEGLLLGALGGGIGVASTVALGLWQHPTSLIAPLVFALVPAAVLPLAAAVSARAELRAAAGAATGGRVRRLVVEAFVVLCCAALVALVAGRGGQVATWDPLLTIIPLALTVIAGIVALRVVPLLLSAAERAGVRSPRLMPLLGPARSARLPAVRSASALAAIVGLAVAVFAVSFAATVDGGIEDTARAQTGAELRVQTAYIGPERLAAARTVPGIASLAPVYSSSKLNISTGGQKVPVRMFVIDSAELADVRAGEASVALPAAPTADSIPIIVSESARARLGGEELTANGHLLTIESVAPDDNPYGGYDVWILVDHAAMRDLGVRQDAPDVLFVRLDPSAKLSDVEAGLNGALAAPQFTTPDGVIAERSADPALQAVRAALAISLALVAALLGVCIVMMLVLGAPARARALQVLRSLGSRSRGFALVAWDVLPTLIVTIPFGAAAGFVMSAVVIAALDLTGFVGGSVRPAIHWGGLGQLVVIVGYTLAVVLIGLVAAAVAAARASRASDQRRREEG